MDLSFIFDDLNDAQRQAVSKDPCPMLVLAGAGSGKTRVLTHRIAWLVTALEVSPLSILAVTFTNKAALEMRHRVERMIGSPMRNMWLGTFHGLSHRFLRTHCADAGLSDSFEILDAQDQHRLVRRSLRELNLDEGFWPPRQVQWFINSNKDEGRRPPQLEGTSDNQHQTLTQVYAHYESLCQRFGLVDFAELLLRCLELFQNNAPIRDAYRERFQHILIDEFQDTDPLQYRIFDRIYRVAENDQDCALLLIGDPKQAIYAFRGADIHTYLRARGDTAGRHENLDTNFRSSQAMVTAVNRVFEHAEQNFAAGAFLFRKGDDNPMPFLPVQARGRSEVWCANGEPAPALTASSRLLTARAEKSGSLMKRQGMRVKWITRPGQRRYLAFCFSRISPQRPSKSTNSLTLQSSMMAMVSSGFIRAKCP